jgi:hypothetical protein
MNHAQTQMATFRAGANDSPAKDHVSANANVLERWLEESNAAEHRHTGRVSAAAYRRLHIEKHRTWFALTSAGVTLMLAHPSVSDHLSACSLMLNSWLSW